MFREAILKRALKLYAGEHVLEHVLKHGNNSFHLGMTRKNMTAYLQDIKSFKPGPTMSQDDILDMLSEYLEGTTKSILDHLGIIENISGTSLTGIFGYKKTTIQEEHACIVALDCLEICNSINEKWDLESPFTVSIGIHSGEMLIGNVGSKHRLNFMTGGENMSIVNQIQGLNQKHNSQILISELTQKVLPSEEYHVTEKDRIVVAGEKFLTVYELIN